MQFNNNPVFRKAIVPWYDSNPLCRTLIFAMLVVFAFSIDGIVVALNNQEFVEHVWFPGLLACLSLFLVIKIFFRLKTRSKSDTYL
jgi:hypothetical protein